MGPRKQKNRVISYTLPGIIVLTFGLLALYFAVGLIHSRTVYQDHYRIYLTTLNDFHQKYYAFSRKFHGIEHPPSEPQLAMLKQELLDLRDRYDVLEAERV